MRIFPGTPDAMFIWLQPVVLLVVYSDMLPTNKAWMTKPSLKNFWLIFDACFFIHQTLSLGMVHRDRSVSLTRRFFIVVLVALTDKVQCLISFMNVLWQFPSRLEPPPRRRSGSSRQTWETANKGQRVSQAHKK